MEININVRQTADPVLVELLSKLLGALQKMSVDFSALTAAVTAETSVNQAASTLISGLSQQLAAAILASSSLSTEDKVKLDDIVAQMNSQNAALSAAVVANTPAASAPPTTPPTTLPAAQAR